MSTDATETSPCPRCRHDLRVMFDTGRNRCPECGLRFSKRDIYVLRHPPDPEGAPTKTNPAEPRLGGRVMVVIFLALAVAVMAFSTWVALLLRARA